MTTKVINNFVWLIVTDKAKEIYSSGIFELYVLHNDNSESLIEEYSQISEAQENGLEIGIEVDHLDSLNKTEEEEEEEPDDYCGMCSGTGEGMWEGSFCSFCNGSGEFNPNK